jgi:hypothetical protein
MIPQKQSIVNQLCSIKHGFAGGKAPVRGLFRITCMVVGAAAVVNIRRLHRFWQEKIRAKQGGSQPERTNQKGRATMRLFFLCFEQLGRYNGYRWPYNPFNAQPSVGNFGFLHWSHCLRIIQTICS